MKDKIEQEIAAVRAQGLEDKRQAELDKLAREEHEILFLAQERDAIEKNGNEEVQKEMRKLKEILGQEYEYRRNQLEQSFSDKHMKLEQQMKEEHAAFIEQKELEHKALIQEERAKLQHDRIRNHAQTTQELYDDIHKTLKEKFLLEQKAKLGEITAKLTRSFQDKISKIENIKEKELAQERKRLAQIELKFAQQENTVFNQTQKMTKMEAELNKNKTIQQQLTNL